MRTIRQYTAHVRRCYNHFFVGWNSSWKLKKSGTWGYKWRWYSPLEQIMFFLLNISPFRNFRLAWVLGDMIFPQTKHLSSVRCICERKGLGLLKHWLLRHL